MSLAKTKKRKLRHRQGELRRSPLQIRKQFLGKVEYDRLANLINHDRGLHEDQAQDPLLIGFDEVGRGCVAGPVCTAAYSCKAFYDAGGELLAEVRRSQQLMANEFTNISLKDKYYAETFVNDIADDYQEVEDLGSLLLLDDSKKVPHAKREALCAALLDLPSEHILYSTNLQSAAKIDSDGIVAAIYTSMTVNLLEIVLQYVSLYNKHPREVLLLIDGTKTITNILDLLEQELNVRRITDLNFVLANNKKAPNGSIIIKQQNIIRGDGLSASIAAASNLAKQARDSHMQLMDDANTYGWSKNVGYGTRKHLEAIRTHGLHEEHRRSFLSNYANKQEGVTGLEASRTRLANSEKSELTIRQ